MGWTFPARMTLVRHVASRRASTVALMTSSTIIASASRSFAFISEQALAERWGVTAGALANSRSASRSPVPYTKVFNRVRYRVTDVEAYEAAQVVAA
jgi:hypothetical protein